jgi:3-hydroxyacyl-CoA dehydrogenase/3a,7a,12a-trihydroxy-5b-cholest-24-enoyl-CoA hydratase
MNHELRFDGRVAVITGAGGGLGRAYARLLAARGARIVVNDIGSSAHGSGQDLGPAERVVAEIRESGGEAVANTDSVVEGGRIVSTALDAFGRIDIVVNNAGFLRDGAFHKMSDADWDDLYAVHLRGAFAVTRAAWPHLREANYGRVINTSSAAGIYGNFGQVNYAAFKLALHGFTQALAAEGRARGVHANTIAPAADSRLTRTVMTPEQLAPMGPELVAPVVAWLCHENCKETGGLFEAGGGWIAKLRWERARGAVLCGDAAQTPEAVAQTWDQITDFADADHPASFQDAMAPLSAIMTPA